MFHAFQPHFWIKKTGLKCLKHVFCGIKTLFEMHETRFWNPKTGSKCVQHVFCDPQKRLSIASILKESISTRCFIFIFCEKNDFIYNFGGKMISKPFCAKNRNRLHQKNRFNPIIPNAIDRILKTRSIAFFQKTFKRKVDSKSF